MTQPPLQTRRRLTAADYICFGLVGFIIAYAVYRVNDVLVYNWNWSEFLILSIYYDEETARYVPNLLPMVLQRHCGSPFGPPSPPPPLALSWATCELARTCDAND